MTVVSSPPTGMYEYDSVPPFDMEQAWTASVPPAHVISSRYKAFAVPELGSLISLHHFNGDPNYQMARDMRSVLIGRSSLGGSRVLGNLFIVDDHLSIAARQIKDCLMTKEKLKDFQTEVQKLREDVRSQRKALSEQELKVAAAAIAQLQPNSLWLRVLSEPDASGQILL